MGIPAMTNDSAGMSVAPGDVCKTPAPPALFVPVPYVNIAQTQNARGSRQVLISNKQSLRMGDSIRISSGNEAGVAGGGMLSATIKGPAQISDGSRRVLVEGRALATLGSPVSHNQQNQPQGTFVVPSETPVLLV